MMNARTRMAPAIIASGIVSHHEIDMVKYITTHRPIKGTKVLRSCQTARGTEGFWYRATICFQFAASEALSLPVKFALFITNKPPLRFPTDWKVIEHTPHRRD